MTRTEQAVIAVIWIGLATSPAFGQADAKLAAYKAEAVRGVDQMAKLAQEMVDTVFSFGELGFQEVETSKYLTGLLEKHGF
jgi:aminobenzoyl-glutamate utilization protein B